MIEPSLVETGFTLIHRKMIVEPSVKTQFGLSLPPLSWVEAARSHHRRDTPILVSEIDQVCPNKIHS